MTTDQQVRIPDKLADLKLTPPEWNWQGAQQEIADRIANSPKKIIMLEAECGSGKSVIPLAAAKAANRQALVLIRTIQLQEQYLGDINNLTMLTGRSRYICDVTGHSAELAPCTIGVRCSLKGVWNSDGRPLTIPECSYFREKAAAVSSQFAILNYAYWLREIRSEKSSFSKLDWIVCDEAHEIDQVLMDAGVISFKRDNLKAYIKGWPKEATVPAMMEYVQENYKTIKAAHTAARRAAIDNGLIELPDEAASQIIDPRSDEARAIITEMRRVSAILQGFDELAVLSPEELEEFVYQFDGKTLEIRPIFGKYAFKKLAACAKEKVILMSAFLAPEALIKNLGLDPDDVDIIMAPQVYDRSKSKIFFCPTVKMGYNTSDQEWRYVVSVIDMIAKTFASRKGIIHVPSVKLRDLVYNNVSRETRDRLICYDGVDTDNIFKRFPDKATALREFTRVDKPAILLGQSVSTGVDLPHVPQWQIITKLSFPPITNPALAKRHAVDKLFMSYLTLCELVQAAGRIKRAKTHDGPTFILDAQFGWFHSRMIGHMPVWFKRALVRKGWDAWPVFQKQLSGLAFRNGIILSKDNS